MLQFDVVTDKILRHFANERRKSWRECPHADTYVYYVVRVGELRPNALRICAHECAVNVCA